ncbi:MAG: hypothetical protein M0031_09395 [Thermaerobacter sp.]|nr:hypothetical protein [Thermaerobacter sp.]
MRRAVTGALALMVLGAALAVGARTGMLQGLAAAAVRARVVALGVTSARLADVRRIPVYTTAGRPTRLDASRRPVLFVATWCPHCRREVPQIARLVAAGRSRPPVVVSTLFLSGSIRTDEAATEAFVRRFHLEGWPVYLQRGDPWPYVPRGVPELILVRDGKAVRLYGALIRGLFSQKP